MSECPTCGGLGVTCIDDICRASGECIHGDGWCPTCGGMPEDYDDGRDDYEDFDDGWEGGEGWER